MTDTSKSPYSVMANVLGIGVAVMTKMCGGVVDGKEVVMQVKEGQKVIYSKYAGNEVKLDGEEFVIVRQNDILAIVED